MVFNMVGPFNMVGIDQQSQAVLWKLMDPPPGDAQPCSVEGPECASLSIIYAHHFSVHVKLQIPLKNVNEYEWVEHCQ